MPRSIGFIGIMEMLRRRLLFAPHELSDQFPCGKAKVTVAYMEHKESRSHWPCGCKMPHAPSLPSALMRTRI